ncbi:hypothetical protein LTR81_019572 [Elasticomyces elasticus]
MLDPERFPLQLMQELVDYLHYHNQHYLVMIDPAVTCLPYPTFQNGVDTDACLKFSNGRSISNKTLNTNLIHYGAYAVYDRHNTYGAMMSEASRSAMLSRKPTSRPQVITHGMFAGSDHQVGHWLGNNDATWADYLISIGGLIDLSAFFQVPVVGSDVCGYADVTNEPAGLLSTLSAPSTATTRPLASRLTNLTDDLSEKRHGTSFRRDTSFWTTSTPLFTIKTRLERRLSSPWFSPVRKTAMRTA